MFYHKLNLTLLITHLYNNKKLQKCWWERVCKIDKLSLHKAAYIFLISVKPGK